MKIDLTVNGQPRQLDVPPLARLLDILRLELGLTGTKEGCGEGECGACTVLLDGEAVCSCLVPACQLDGATVRTIEGLETASGELDPLQRAFVEGGAVQCGFCTPGMVLAARALLDRDPDPDEREIRTALSGNLCRCTGYTKIIASVQRAAAAERGQARGGEEGGR